MTQEQREDIERQIDDILDPDAEFMAWHGKNIADLIPLARFARQQLNIRVDGEKLMEAIINANLVRPQCAEDEHHPIINVWEANASEQLEALVMECLTTEEKE